MVTPPITTGIIITDRLSLVEAFNSHFFSYCLVFNQVPDFSVGNSQICPAQGAPDTPASSVFMVFFSFVKDADVNKDLSN